MSRKPWRFTDLITSEVYYMPVNPLTDEGSNAITKNVKYASAISTYSSPTLGVRVDDILVQDSPSEIKRFSYGGTLYTREEYEALIEWFSKPYEWELRDDLGREFLIFAESFAPKRERSAKFPWKHSYTISGVIMRELGV